MSKLKAQIQEDIKAAMKQRKQELVVTLRGLVAEINKAEIDGRTELSDDQCLGLIQKEIKKRRDTISFAEQGNRTDLVEQNKNEISMLQNYLGEQLGEDQLRKIISELVSAGANSIGAVMGALNKEHKGKFEGKIASELVKEILE